MERIDHIALPVADISAALDWYREHFTCETLCVDESWALLGFENISLALVLPYQHPPHFAVTRADAESHGTVTPHRDGTASVYTRDPWNNAIEIMKPDARA